MTNGYWLLLIILLSVIVITFFLVKERGILYGMPSTKKEGLSIVSEAIIHDQANLDITVNGKKFVPPPRGSADLQNFISFIDQNGFPTLIGKGPTTTDNLGNYRDGGYRRLPYMVNNNNDGRTNNPQMCKEWANNSGFPLSGIQWYGECWGGYDVQRATAYGPNPAINQPDFQYGRGWNNLIYHTHSSTTVAITGYPEFVKWLIVNGVVNYEKFKTFTEGFQGMEGFTEGLDEYKGAIYPFISASVNQSITKQTQQFLNASPVTTYAEKYKFALDTGEENSKLLDEIKIANNLNISTQEFFRICSQYGILTSSAVNQTRQTLASIGFDKNTPVIIGMLYMTYWGVKQPTLADPNFVKPYQQFGLGPTQQKLVGVLILAYAIGVSEKDKSEFRFPDFVSATQQLDSGINASNFDTPGGYNDLVFETYRSRSDNTNFNKFIESVLNFDKTKPRNIEALRNFRDKVINTYGLVGFPAYKGMLQFFTNNKIRIGCSMSDFMAKFYKYYDVINHAYDGPGPGGHIPFDQCIKDFITNVLNKGKSDNPFGITADYNFDEFIDRLIRMNVQINEITGSQIGTKLYSTYFNESFTSYTSNYIEAFTGSSIVVEGLTPAGANGYTNYLSNMGAKNLQSINIGNGEIVSENGLDGKLITGFGAHNQEEKVSIIYFFYSIGMQTTDINPCIMLLTNFGIKTIENLNTLKQSLLDVKLTGYTDIQYFLNTIYKFGVNFTTLNSFTGELSSFGVDLKKDKQQFYDFISLLTNYDITYTRNPYDSCRTKFSNFIQNLVEDSITITFWDLIVKPMMKILNNGVEPTAPPKDMKSKRTVNRNMRDLIILRSKSLYNGSSLDATKSNSFAECNTQLPPLQTKLSDAFKTDQAKYKTNDGHPFLTELDNGTPKPMFLDEVIPDDYIIDPVRLKKRLFYAYIFAQQKLPSVDINKVKNPTQLGIPLNYMTIVSMITPQEYEQFKHSSPNLIPSSVMSALYANLMVESSILMSKQDYAGFNNNVDMINFIRTVPYYTFRLIAKEIHSHTDSKGICERYDNYQDPRYRQVEKGVSPYYNEDGSEIDGAYLDDYTDDYNLGNSSSTSNYAGVNSSVKQLSDPTGIYVEVAK